MKWQQIKKQIEEDNSENTYKENEMVADQKSDWRGLRNLNMKITRKKMKWRQIKKNWKGLLSENSIWNQQWRKLKW